MRAPALLADDFARAFRNLLPRGKVWPRDIASTVYAVSQAVGPTYERQTSRANNLLVDAFPATTVELLPEWEKSLGLPNPCAGMAPTIEQRRAQVLARFANTGGQSRAFYIGFARQLGYEIGIVDYAPFRASWSAAGSPVASEDWAFVWGITAPLNQINYFRAGVGAAGEPLAYWSNDVLECEMNAIKPAHTILLFLYS